MDSLEVVPGSSRKLRVWQQYRTPDVITSTQRRKLSMFVRKLSTKNGCWGLSKKRRKFPKTFRFCLNISETVEGKASSSNERVDLISCLEFFCHAKDSSILARVSSCCVVPKLIVRWSWGCCTLKAAPKVLWECCRTPVLGKRKVQWTTLISVTLMQSIRTVTYPSHC